MEDPARYPIWALIRRARQDAGLTQRELAERAGTSQSAIARYERARVMPDIPTLYRIVRACGFDLRHHLAEIDDSDATLIESQLTRTPSERAEIARQATQLVAEARRA